MVFLIQLDSGSVYTNGNKYRGSIRYLSLLVYFLVVSI